MSLRKGWLKSYLEGKGCPHLPKWLRLLWSAPHYPLSICVPEVQPLAVHIGELAVSDHHLQNSFKGHFHNGYFIQRKYPVILQKIIAACWKSFI